MTQKVVSKAVSVLRKIWGPRGTLHSQAWFSSVEAHPAKTRKFRRWRRITERSPTVRHNNIPWSGADGLSGISVKGDHKSNLRNKDPRTEF